MVSEICRVKQPFQVGKAQYNKGFSLAASLKTWHWDT
jgi:hypothetical protein